MLVGGGLGRDGECGWLCGEVVFAGLELILTLFLVEIVQLQKVVFYFICEILKEGLDLSCLDDGM